MLWCAPKVSSQQQGVKQLASLLLLLIVIFATAAATVAATGDGCYTSLYSRSYITACQTRSSCLPDVPQSFTVRTTSVATHRVLQGDGRVPAGSMWRKTGM